jgi:peptidoglycan/LPS O-acetylase OafA/YrhL
MNSFKLLSDVLKKDGNNFDLLRLIAAIAVIVGHAYALSPQPPYQDGVVQILHFDYSGSLAVKFFFFLSGMLVTNSIISKPDAFQFLAKRAFRIFPGLLVCLLVSVLIVGPLFTELPLTDYFFNRETWSYLKKNFLLMDIQWRLPGVFDKSKYGVNGSLWTLPYEVLCYLYLAILFGLGLLRNTIIADIFFFVVIGISFIAPTYLPVFFSNNPESYLLPACFAMGALYANNKKIIPIGLYHALLICLLAYILKNSIAKQFTFYIAFFYVSVYISSIPWVIKKIKLPFDASYGVYVYGFVIQQSVNAALPHIGVHAHQFVSAIIAVAVGYLSWRFVEKRFIDLGHRIFSPDVSNRVKAEFLAFIKRGQVTLQAKQQRRLLITCMLVVPIIIFVYFLKFKTYVIYGDDLHSYINHERLTTLWQKLNLPVFYDKYRPVQGVVQHLLIEIFNKHTGGYFLFNIAIQTVNTFMFAMLVNLFLRSPFLSLLLSLLVGLSRFSFYNVTQLLNGGPLEGLAMTFFLVSLFFIIRVLVQQDRTVIQKQRDIICFFIFANLDMYTHERYIMLIPFAILLILFYPGLRFFSLKQKAILSFIGIASIVLNIVIKKYGFSLPFLYGTGGQTISPSFSSIFTFLTEGLLSICQVNYGPEYLIGIKFTALPGFDKLLVLLLLGCFVTIFVLYIRNVWKAFALKQKEEIAFFTIFLSLGVLFFLFLAPAVVNIRLEQRWLQASFSIFILMIGLALSRIPVKNVMYRNWALLLFVLAFIKVEFSYLKNGHQHIYLTTASNISNSFKQAIDNGVIKPESSRLYIWDKKRDEGSEVSNWALQNGFFFKLYQNKNKEIVFIDPTYKFDSTKTLDTINERIIYLKNTVTDVTSDYFRSPKLDFGAHKVNIFMTFQELNKYTHSGFYDTENGFRWTNGNAAINFGDANYSIVDSLKVNLRVLQIPASDKITPKLVIKDKTNQEHHSFDVKKAGDVFTYLFVFERSVDLHEIGIKSETFDASPDSRVLSIPFISLELKN